MTCYIVTYIVTALRDLFAFTEAVTQQLAIVFGVSRYLNSKLALTGRLIVTVYKVEREVVHGKSVRLAVEACTYCCLTVALWRMLNPSGSLIFRGGHNMTSKDPNRDTWQQ